MSPDIVAIIVAAAAVIGLLTAVLGLTREILQRRQRDRQHDLMSKDITLQDFRRLVLSLNLEERIELEKQIELERMGLEASYLAVLLLHPSEAEKPASNFLPQTRRSQPWHFRLTFRAIPDELREFSDEILSDRDDALDYAAAHPDALHKWSDTREAVSFVVKILKYRIVSLRVTVTRRRKAE